MLMFWNHEMKLGDEECSSVNLSLLPANKEETCNLGFSGFYWFKGDTVKADAGVRLKVVEL